jgi:hypothetical protein
VGWCLRRCLDSLLLWIYCFGMHCNNGIDVLSFIPYPAPNKCACACQRDSALSSKGRVVWEQSSGAGISSQNCRQAQLGLVPAAAVAPAREVAMFWSPAAGGGCPALSLHNRAFVGGKQSSSTWAVCLAFQRFCQAEMCAGRVCADSAVE